MDDRISFFKGFGMSEETIFKKYTKQGCGKCPRSVNNKIPCRECKTDLCNTEKYFQQVKFCWVRDIAACPLNIWNGFCYYNVRNKKGTI